MTKKSIFKGAATALITPFLNGDVDYVALGSLIDRQIDCGIDALVICGTTGESATLSDEEHHRILDFALKRADGRVPMIAGTGSNDTAHAVGMSKFAADLGYDGLLVVTPYYNKATEKGLIASFERIADASTVPIILYNVPTRTCCNITLPVYKALAKHENIVAVKEASGNVSAIAELFAECGDDFDIYSGNDDQTLPMLALGGSGVISVVSNIIPREMADLCQKWFDGDIEECRRLHEKYLKLMKMMFCEVNPIPVKCAAELMKLCSSEMRLPMCEIGEENRGRLMGVLQKYGLL
ncbi:MAG: 4-hydroxy-tetrahydrodipicolinate synthase [Clostridia bacterium]|nr:4-hydroxy-tetrahydrodipicolinate synthase [Clostridia bacterium]